MQTKIKRTIFTILLLTCCTMTVNAAEKKAPGVVNAATVDDIYIEMPSMDTLDTFVNKNSKNGVEILSEQDILNHYVEYADRYVYGQSSRWTKKWWLNKDDDNYYLLRETDSNFSDHYSIKYEMTNSGKIVQLLNKDGEIIARMTESEYNKRSKQRLAVVTNTWYCDRDKSWYLLDATDGHMVSGLIHDKSTDLWYYISVNHDGTFGHLQTQDGFYTINGTTYRLEFEQYDSEKKGSITKGLDHLKKAKIDIVEDYITKNRMEADEDQEKEWLKKVDSVITATALSIYRHTTKKSLNSNEAGYQVLAKQNPVFGRYYQYKQDGAFKEKENEKEKVDLVTKRTKTGASLPY